MFYEVLQSSPTEVDFVTHHRARRGRGVLYATTPFVLYLLAVSGGFVYSMSDLTAWQTVKSFAAWGLIGSAALAFAFFALGYRVRDRVQGSASKIRVTHTPAFGPDRVKELASKGLLGLAIDPNLRSLGADLLLVAVSRDGARTPIAEGEPHSAQVRQFAAQLASITALPLEAPKFEVH